MALGCGRSPHSRPHLDPQLQGSWRLCVYPVGGQPLLQPQPFLPPLKGECPVLVSRAGSAEGGDGCVRRSRAVRPVIRQC